jgi:hypothetical protein
MRLSTQAGYAEAASLLPRSHAEELMRTWRQAMRFRSAGTLVASGDQRHEPAGSGGPVRRREV